MTAGQPTLTISATVLPGAKPSWMTVSLTTPSPAGSISNVTVERGSPAILAESASSQPKRLASSGVKLCQAYDRRRYGSDSITTCSGSAIITPWLSQVIGDPGAQSVMKVVS